jgi:hypothetical protein
VEKSFRRCARGCAKGGWKKESSLGNPKTRERETEVEQQPQVLHSPPLGLPAAGLAEPQQQGFLMVVDGPCTGRSRTPAINSKQMHHLTMQVAYSVARLLSKVRKMVSEKFAVLNKLFKPLYNDPGAATAPGAKV